MYNLLLSLNFLLMIAMPLLLGWLIAKKRSIRWGLFAIGCGTFILSQLGHIPFNYFALDWLQVQTGSMTDSSRLIVTSVFLGLSAAVFEEGARYLGYRYWASDARTWGSSMMLGTGHGGAESIILGMIVGINTILLIAWNNDRLTALIPVDQEPMLAAILDSLFSAPWYTLILGALERLFVIILHLAFSLLVMLSFVRRQPLWLAVAIFCHALVDAVAVYSAVVWGPYIAEALIAIMALFGLLFVLRMREPEPVEKEPVPLPPPEKVGPLPINVTNDNLDDSRFNY